MLMVLAERRTSFVSEDRRRALMGLQQVYFVKMVRVCAVPNCDNKMKKYNRLSFHRLPLYDPETLPLWLVVLQIDVQTPFQVLRKRDYRVCSEHFDEDDFSPTSEKCRHLKKNAVPRPVAITTEVMSSSTFLLLFFF